MRAKPWRATTVVIALASAVVLVIDSSHIGRLAFSDRLRSFFTSLERSSQAATPGSD